MSDPSNPRITASIDIPPGLHSHKVRVANDLMLVNRERTRGDMPNGGFCRAAHIRRQQPRQAA